MKDLFFIFLLPFYLISNSVGNPGNPYVIQEGLWISDKLSVCVKAGSEGYFILNEKDRFDKSAREASFHALRLDGVAASGLVRVTLFERMDIYSLLGSMHMEPRFKINEIIYKAKTENRLWWKAGTKLILLQWNDTCLGGDINFSGYKSPTEYVDRNGAAFPSGDFKFRFKQWQIALGLSTKIGYFYPYAGAAIINKDMRMDELSFSEKRRVLFKQPHRAGAFIGVTLSPVSTILIAAEARFINENSITVNAEIRF